MCTGSHAFIPALDTAKVDFIQKYDDQMIVNSMYFQKSGGWSESEIRNLAETAGDAWVANWQTQVVNALVYQITRATDVSVDNSWQFEDPTHLGETGALSGAGLPGGSALVVKQTTGHTGRSFRGRTYVSGLDRTQASLNEVNGDYAIAIKDAVQATVQDIETAFDCFHVVASYCQEGSWLSNAQLTPITAYQADVFIDSQRRRLTGRGV